MTDACFFNNDDECIDDYELYIFSLCFYDGIKYRKQYNAEKCKNDKEAIKWANDYFNLRMAQLSSLSSIQATDFSYMLFKPIKTDLIQRSELQ